MYDPTMQSMWQKHAFLPTTETVQQRIALMRQGAGQGLGIGQLLAQDVRDATQDAPPTSQQMETGY